MDINIRPRRIRRNSVIREVVRETRINSSSLVYPIFIKEGKKIKEEIPSMPGQFRYSIDMLDCILEEVAEAGIKSVLLFGIPNEKDDCGSHAWIEDGIIQRALQQGKKHYPELLYITDVCMCEYTSHGHCGILNGTIIDNDKTLEVLSKIALSHAQAGSDIIAPSDMMDGRVRAIRAILDRNNYSDIGIMSYAVKYSSAFYGPFREAANSTPSFGDRKSYQMDYHNRKEAKKEVILDIEEGADIIIIKPALSYMDIIREISDIVNIPIATYNVSGEYSMVKAAAKLGYIEENEIICEMATSFYRAGANIVITYFAKEIVEFIKEGRIG